MDIDRAERPQGPQDNFTHKNDLLGASIPETGQIDATTPTAEGIGTEIDMTSLDVDYFRDSYATNKFIYRSLRNTQSRMEMMGLRPDTQLASQIAETRTRLLGGAAIIAVLEPRVEISFYD